ncbi:MAG: hypothetical protein WCA46_12160, partial [Actinocatenispora sp.]
VLTRARPAGPTALARSLARRAERSARATAALAAGMGAAVGLALAGPVGALVVAGYLCVAVHVVLRRRARRAAARIRATALDAVTALSDDLRAGLPPRSALGRAWPRLVDTGSGAASPPARDEPSLVLDDPVPMLRADPEPTRAPVTARLATAWQLAAETGAPLADLLGRLDTELTDRERLRRRATAQAAGASATSLLLAMLPAAGLGLGLAIGADPLHVLLHTGVGAVCAVVTLVLQCAGLVWSGRLTRLDHEAPA